MLVEPRLAHERKKKSPGGGSIRDSIADSLTHL